MKKGKIFNIQSFSVSDGPGIRTVVFFQGCNLKCLWCHNPESQKQNAPEAFIREKCIKCEICRPNGECYTGAIVKTCRDFTADELWSILSNDVPYLKNSGGGVTFSGGECMLQAGFLQEIVKRCSDNGVHTAVDTAGHVPFEFFERVNPDLFLYDIKAFSPEKHMEFTGVDGKLIWDNLARLANSKYRICVRIPCVPGANWDELPQIFSELCKLGINKIELLAYHSLGEGKAEIYGNKPQTFIPPTKKEMSDLWSLLGFQKK
ncbi:MAG: radical SAM protein [Defluviitaleaceae bacterium]|nr:radical SAM protein [Defluviitaleaceae bacterium]